MSSIYTSEGKSTLSPKGGTQSKDRHLLASAPQSFSLWGLGWISLFLPFYFQRFNDR